MTRLGFYGLGLVTGLALGLSIGAGIQLALVAAAVFLCMWAGLRLRSLQRRG